MIVRRARLAAIVTPFLLAPSMPAQDLPDGPGKELLMNVCTQCHTLNRIVEKKADGRAGAEATEADAK